MGYVDDAFEKCKAALNITQTEAGFASRKHNDIRDLVRESWKLSDDFLTGSYRRDTKTKPLKDVDIFVEIDRNGGQAGLRQQHPSKVLEALWMLLDQAYDKVEIDGFACTVHFGDSDDVASFDVVPAFKLSGGGWEIPDADRGDWIRTNPKTHHKQSTKKNEACGDKFVPFVKMIKGINREAGEPIAPSFLLEVMAQTLVKEPFGRYQDEIRFFLASAADQAGQDWPDPADFGPVVNSQLSARDRQDMAATLREWLAIAEEAIRLEDAGSERAAVEEWKRLFGSRMPRP
jgi:predicted nucleotidyltransferase